MSKSDLKRLGDYIREVDVRNTELAITKLYGVNLNKEFMPSVANIIGTDLTKYKVISYNQFGCKLMSVERDKKMPISLMKEVEPAIMSSAYFVFEVKDEDILMPDYLFLQIKNPEFDRRLWFSSGGDVRGGVGFNNLEDMPILVPPLEEQRKIVERHKAIQQRIEVNRKTIAKLEEAAQAIYRKMFVDDIDPENLPKGWEINCLDSIIKFKNGKNINSENGNFPVYGGNGIVGYSSEFNSENVVIIGRVGINCGNLNYEKAKCWVNDNAIIAQSELSPIFILKLLSSLKLNFLSEGSSQPLITQNSLNSIVTPIPPLSLIEKYCRCAVPIYEYLLLLKKENLKLQSLYKIL